MKIKIRRASGVLTWSTHFLNSNSFSEKDEVNKKEEYFQKMNLQLDKLKEVLLGEEEKSTIEKSELYVFLFFHLVLKVFSSIIINN
jgi:hypothetical protein